MLIGVIRDILRGGPRVEPRGSDSASGAKVAESQRAPPVAQRSGSQRAARVQIAHDGITREFETLVDLDDIKRHGVACSQPMLRPFAGSTGWVERLATLLNIAHACRENGLPQEELAALRMARRMSGGTMELVNRAIANSAVRDVAPVTKQAGPRIVSYALEPVAFLKAVGAAGVGNNFHHPGAEFGGLSGIDGRLLVPQEPSADNVSFAVCDGDRRLAVVPCVIQRDDTVSWVAIHVPAGGIPVNIAFDEGARSERQALELILDHFEWIMRTYGARQVVVQEPFQESMSLYRILSLSSMFAAEIWTRPVVRLDDVNEAQLFARVRKSYKSNINWGRTNLAMEYLSGDQLSPAKLQEVHALLTQCHQKLIERYGNGLTQSMYMAPMIMCQMQKGEVAIARTRDGQVCGVTVVTDAGGISHYTLGGSIPQRNKNPGHFIVYDSMLRAKARGARFYHVNREYGAPVSIDGLQLKIQSEHDTNLIFFKRGFGDQLETFNVYKVFPRNLAALGR